MKWQDLFRVVTTNGNCMLRSCADGRWLKEVLYIISHTDNAKQVIGLTINVVSLDVIMEDSLIPDQNVEHVQVETVLIVQPKTHKRVRHNKKLSKLKGEKT